jgi:serine/threonine protein phosphatase PrpC
MWRVMGQSVQGAAHKRNRLPNQDAMGWMERSGIALAVADGHGSADCPRSDVGAALAVDTTIGLLHEFIEQRQKEGPRAIASLVSDWLPRELASRWRAMVSEHFAANQYTEQERKEIGARKRSDIWTAYGSTVLGVYASDDIVIYLQLGDGDILIVSSDGEVTRPWPKDNRLLGVETTSLCSERAWEEVRLLVRTEAMPLPELVLLSTDGYCNSFREDRGFLRIGTDLLDMIRQNGLDSLQDCLSGWLNEASELGSGDDITLALLSRVPERSHAG